GDLGEFIAARVGDASDTGGTASEPVPQPAAVSRSVLRARDNVRVRIEDDAGTAPVSQTLAKGDVYHVPDHGGLVLIVRDAGALEYSLDGGPYDRLGKPGQILVSHPLVPDKISAIGG